jgi:hypothetical protein
VTVTPAIFAEWRAPRFGDANPTRLDNPLWASLVHDRINAYQVNKRYGYERQYGAGPTWCFDRFGQSATTLGDGRVVYIAGEHEDYYDPDFFIYNDIVIVAPGGEVAIYGYPREVFPPTDFHSATLLDNAILLVGSLGYATERVAVVTPVYRLALATMAIEPIATTGDSPGWIHKHTATLAGTTLLVRGGIIDRGDDRALEDNIDEWSLDIATWQWKRRTQLDWQRWTMERADGKRALMFELRQMLWNAEHPAYQGSVDYRATSSRRPAASPSSTCCARSTSSMTTRARSSAAKARTTTTCFASRSTGSSWCSRNSRLASLRSSRASLPKRGCTRCSSTCSPHWPRSTTRPGSSARVKAQGGR